MLWLLVALSPQVLKICVRTNKCESLSGSQIVQPSVSNGMIMPAVQDSARQLAEEGFSLFANVFSRSECNALLHQLESALRNDREHIHVRQAKGTVFAARNIMSLLPSVVSTWKKPVLVDFLQQELGPDCGLVRVLYFDKPSHRSWSLPFHKDMTIAVKDNSLPTNEFCKPTRKAGVDHVEGSEAVLRQMATLRIHLDDVDEANGPLQVIPGSHLSGKSVSAGGQPAQKILCQAGDVLVMRPLISHASGHSDPEKKKHRRILHLEFCGIPMLPDRYQWHSFVRIDADAAVGGLNS